VRVILANMDGSGAEGDSSSWTEISTTTVWNNIRLGCVCKNELCDVGDTYQGDDVVEQVGLAHCHTHEPLRLNVDNMNMEVICVFSADPIEHEHNNTAERCQAGSRRLREIGRIGGGTMVTHSTTAGSV
jgi:hypothetical protein